MKLVLLGPPGAGKGTHADVLKERYDLFHHATGAVLRGHIRNKTPLGIKAKDIIESGGLVPDNLVNEMMADEITKVGVKKGAIFDGYPRTIGQAEALDGFLTEKGTKLDVALDFATSEEMIMKRLSGRRVCSGCNTNYHVRNIPPKKEGICDKCGKALIQRKDDSPEAINTRLAMYEKETRPLIDYYKQKGCYQEIPGDYDVAELQEVLKLLFERLKLIS